MDIKIFFLFFLSLRNLKTLPICFDLTFDNGTDWMDSTNHTCFEYLQIDSCKYFGNNFENENKIAN